MKECRTPNKHIGEIAAVSPQKRQCELGSYYPARTFVKPLPRQYATTLSASGESAVENVEKLERLRQRGKTCEAVRAGEKYFHI